MEGGEIMKRRIVPFVLVLILAISLCTTAFAAARASRVTPNLSFSGTTANCKVTITEFGKEINATLELWCGKTLIDSWSDSATSRLTISESHRVVSGKTYTLKVTGTIGGEAISSTPVTGTCP